MPRATAVFALLLAASPPTKVPVHEPATVQVERIPELGVRTVPRLAPGDGIIPERWIAWRADGGDCRDPKAMSVLPPEYVAAGSREVTLAFRVLSDPTNWEARQLFDKSRDGGGPLDSFCVFELNLTKPELQVAWKTGELQEAIRDYVSRTLAPDAAASAALFPDRYAVVPQETLAGPPDDPVAQEALHWMAVQTGNHLFNLRPAKDWSTLSPEAVRMVVIDTAPDALVSDPSVDLDPEANNSVHGASLALMARHVLCPRSGATAKAVSPPCAATIQTRLALDLAPTPRASAADSDWKPDPAKGGVMGSITGLARAVEATVQEWQHGDAAPGRLVMNLSVGWHPLFMDAHWMGQTDRLTGIAQALRDSRGRPLASQLRGGTAIPASQAVHAALVHARCHGALVFAAAGNRTSGPSHRDGPFYPARWQAVGFDAWSRECASFHPELEKIDEGEQRTPLVVAVGGTNEFEAPLGLTRPDNIPQISAFADHATLPTADGMTPPLAGTSVGTLVASATATAAWAANPKLSPLAILRNLQSTGATESSSPHFSGMKLLGPSVSPPYVGTDMPSEVPTVVVPCAAVQASSPSAFGCVSPQKEENPPAPPLAVYEITYGDSVDIGTTCGEGAVFTRPVTPLSFLDAYKPACPVDDTYGPEVVPWVVTQPHDMGCPVCQAIHRETSPGIYVADLYLKRPADWTDTIDFRTPTVEFVYPNRRDFRPISTIAAGPQWVRVAALGIGRPTAVVLHTPVVMNGQTMPTFDELDLVLE